MFDPYKVGKRGTMARLVMAIAFLAATHGAAQANAECLDRLLASLTAPTDVSTCNLLSLTDGRVVAVRTEHGLFMQTKDGPTSTHYFIDARRKQIEATHFARRHTYPPMDKALPDAKQYYYPFYGVHRSGMARAPQSMRFVCQLPSAFTATNVQLCPGWSGR